MPKHSRADTPAARAGAIDHYGSERLRKGLRFRALEDLGYYSVDNLPVGLIPKFAELTRDSPNIRSAALVVDVREREGLSRFPGIFKRVKKQLSTTLLFLEADDEKPSCAVQRNPAAPPAGNRAIRRGEHRQRAPAVGAHPGHSRHRPEHLQFTVHELRDFIREKFRGDRAESKIMVYINSFGFPPRVPLTATWSLTCVFSPIRTIFRSSSHSPAAIRE